MSYIIVSVRSFKCDYPGCHWTHDSDEHYLRDANRELRNNGWTIRNRAHFCPEHKGQGGEVE